jgi:hypothetical protein
MLHSPEFFPAHSFCAPQVGQGKEMDKENNQIAHRRIVPGREILRKYGQNNNSLPAARACPLYRSGPERKVPGRHGMSYTEEDWVDDEATSRRGPDE